MPNPLIEGFAEACRPSDRRPPWQWCEDNVTVDSTSSMPGLWRSDNSPWCREPMEVVANNRVREVAVMCSAQSSKTQTTMALFCWAMSEDPGPAMWVMANRDDARDFVRDRLTPTVLGCSPLSRNLITQERLNLTFSTGPAYFVGAGSPGKLQGKPIRWLFLDEVRNYPPGALETVLKRTTSFWNSRRLIISTPGNENDAVHRAYLSGDQRVFHVQCPACSKFQPLVWDQMKWDTNDSTKPGGVYDFDRLAETIRYRCRNCWHEIRDTPTERKAMARGGKFVALNPTAPKRRVSFHWNAMLPPWVEWRSLVEEFLRARAAARTGDLNPMRTFVTESLGQPWKDTLGEIEDFDFLLARRGGYEFGDPWPEGKVRMMSADRQASGGEHYWFVVREFGPHGKSRLVSYGRCNTTHELDEVRKTNGVPVANAVIDSGFKASEVYRFCASTGWKPFKGDDADFFTFTDPVTKKVVRRLWQRTRVDPAFGTSRAGRVKPIPLFRWSNPGLKDLLFEHLTGLVGAWTLPREIGRDYLKQITAEHREEERDTRGHVRFRWHQKHKDNHLLDCELMLMAAALIAGIVARK